MSHEDHAVKEIDSQCLLKAPRRQRNNLCVTHEATGDLRLGRLDPETYPSIAVAELRLRFRLERLRLRLRRLPLRLRFLWARRQVQSIGCILLVDKDLAEFLVHKSLRGHDY